MTRTWIAKSAIAALAVLAVSGLAHALALQLWLDDGLTLKGIWTWNSANSAIVKVRVHAAVPDPTARATVPIATAAIVTVIVKARATDGTTVQGSAVGQIPFGSTREFTIRLPKPVTQLMATTVKGSKSNTSE